MHVPCGGWGSVLAGFEGSARGVLASGVSLLRPQDVVFEAILEGWGRQQRGGRGLQAATVAGRVAAVRHFGVWTNGFPWQWSAADCDEWTAHLLGELGRAPSTVRQYQTALRLFCDYVTSPHYQWPEECEERFGSHPVQVCHEWNTLAHLTEYEGDPRRRPMTREEVQALLDYADGQVERAGVSGRKGMVAAYRDATVFKVIYGWGLRCTEASRLDVEDLYRSARAPELGSLGAVQVRFGKRSRGSAPRRRMVLSVMPWAVEALAEYVAVVRPRYAVGEGGALWPTERGGRLARREIEARFSAYRDALGMERSLVPHCLRHSYVTHQIEDGVDPAFVQRQVGHRYASTTALYAGVSGDFMNSMMRRVLDEALRGGH
ncbi:tyrosine-type recombinase/integrase [Streptomyces sp. NBC_01497]|uniref:tyrosine-type recombinase/integrase n=1 Tax=Streptomyces sp. NBC_01497 TaxID=2903885 RepID=UPI002E31DFB0|nr:tyrosine-type recombinase/integrase [Streptomyces sp. NBC_01497]